MKTALHLVFAPVIITSLMFAIMFAVGLVMAGASFWYPIVMWLSGELPLTLVIAWFANVAFWLWFMDHLDTDLVTPMLLVTCGVYMVAMLALFATGADWATVRWWS